ncbi:MAG: ankyrin repeat domain-containing protein [Chitinophagaceae bacterium]
MKKLIDNKDFEGIREALEKNPALANEGIPYDNINTSKAHPLHRICDGVFSKRFTDREAVQIAKIFLAHGARVNGDGLKEKKDTPLLAAASLNADQVAMLYIEYGADIHHAGCHGGTALHWAAWCGRDRLVERLVQEGATVNKLCIDFLSTPLFWAIHGFKSGDSQNLDQYLACAKILLKGGADKTIPNKGGKTAIDLLDDGDLELKRLLQEA